MIRKFEELSLNSWPALNTVVYDGWILRFANGFTKRSNSICPLYFSNEPLDVKVKCCEDIYSNVNQRAIFKLTSEIYPTDLDIFLEKRGYLLKDNTNCMVCTNLDMVKECEISKNKYRILYTLEDNWLISYSQLNDYNKSESTVLSSILNGILQKKFFVELCNEKDTVAFGMGVIEQEFLGIYNILVHPKYRKMGYGYQLMLILLNEGKQLGAQTAYLQVVSNNESAIRLYEKVGFTEAYNYWYRILDN